MRVISLLLLIAFAMVAHAAEFVATRYDLDYKLDYDFTILNGACRMVIKNRASDSARAVPLLLHKLMTVHSIQNQNGQELLYTQRDSTTVNFLEVALADPLAKNKSTTLDIRYSGQMQEKINPEFTLLAWDDYMCPVVGVPGQKSETEQFDYVVTVTLPEDLTAAMTGRLSAIGKGIYTFQNARPAERIDVAIAKYGTLERGTNKVYYLPFEVEGAEQILTAMEKCNELYTRWFGPLHENMGFKVVEVPEGYASHGDASGMILHANEFKNPQERHQLYRELSHQWNVRCIDPQPSRWEDGLATFLEWRAANQLDFANEFYFATDKLVAKIREDLQQYPQRASVAPVDFGTRQIEEMSAAVGAVAFRVLYELVGEAEFNRLVGGFYQEFEPRGATSREFPAYLKRKAQIDLTLYINDWWTGTGWASKMYTGQYK